jgi:hypothetical protein
MMCAFGFNFISGSMRSDLKTAELPICPVGCCFALRREHSEKKSEVGECSLQRHQIRPFAFGFSALTHSVQFKFTKRIKIPIQIRTDP